MCSHYGFLYFEMSSFLSSNNTPGRVSPSKILSLLNKRWKSEFHVWLVSRSPKFGCFLENVLWSYFGNHFQTEIVPESPLFFYFLRVFHMVWKNQELRDWIRWVLEAFKNAKNFLLTIFFCVFELPLWIYELLWNTQFCFFNIIPRGVSNCKILTF